MDWKTLFLTADGRIGQRDFWIGFAILFVAGLVLGMIPVIGQIVGILLIYPNVCLYSKRLHDFGKSGWLQLVPMAIMFVAMVLAIFSGGAGIMASMGGGSAATAGAMAGFGMAAMVMGLAALIGLAFLLWVGLSKGDPGDNRYGPPPRQLVGGSTPTAA